MTHTNNPLPYQCRNYESILSVVSLIPETTEELSKDAGCDTCIHFMSGNCDILSSNIERDSMGLTNPIK